MTRRFLTPLSTDHVDYNTTSTSDNAEGRLRWDSDLGTLAVGLENGAVELPIGQKQGAYVKNTSGVDIGKGKAVQFSGAHGGKIEVEKAVADGSVSSKYMLGITAEAIDDDGFGFVVTDGYIRGVDTDGILLGTLLYFDPDTPGELTTSKPSSGNITAPIAVVTFSNQNSGVIFVRMTIEPELNELEGVSISSLSDGDVLTYSSSASAWQNTQPDVNFVPQLLMGGM
jgi:hypothetical protein